MFAVRTKLLPCTDTKGTRIKATMYVGDGKLSATVAYDHAMRAFDNHRMACQALLLKTHNPVLQLWSGGHLGPGEYAWVREDFVASDRA